MSSVCIATLKPSPGAPSRFAAGTRQSAKASDASGCGAMTSILPSTLRPGVSASTTNALMPRALCTRPSARGASSRARTRNRSPRCRRSRSRSSSRSGRSSRRRHAPASASPRRRSRRRAPTAQTPRSPRLARRAAGSGLAASSDPASEIAPEPRPCIANAKSASPSWRASVSRAMQRLRESMRSSRPPQACGTQYSSQPDSPSIATRLWQAASVSTWSCPAESRSTAQASSSRASMRCVSSKKGRSR